MSFVIIGYAVDGLYVAALVGTYVCFVCDGLHGRLDTFTICSDSINMRYGIDLLKRITFMGCTIGDRGARH